jgi:hypothetical protein
MVSRPSSSDGLSNLDDSEVSLRAFKLCPRGHQEFQPTGFRAGKSYTIKGLLVEGKISIAATAQQFDFMIR